MTVIEAMAAGIAPVCIKDESFETVVIDGLNGHLFKNKNEYIKIIKKLIDDRTELETLSKQARLNAEAHSSKYYAERVLDVYNTTQTKKKGFFRSMFDNILGRGEDDE